jgi:hypothetical protein
MPILFVSFVSSGEREFLKNEREEFIKDNYIKHPRETGSGPLRIGTLNCRSPNIYSLLFAA